MDDLLDNTRAMLLQRPASLTYREIADGTGLTEAWLKKFASSPSLDPRVSHVQTLYNYLKKV